MKHNIQQFVMAYGVEQDRLRAILPKGFCSLRPVLRINAEITDGDTVALEFNTAIEKDGNKGWINIGHWRNVQFENMCNTTVFHTDNLTISFEHTGIEGSCPAEKDNAGCYFLEEGHLRLPEAIAANKEFCNCEFRWSFDGKGAYGKSIGKTLPAIPSEPKTVYSKADFTVKNAAIIPCEQVLGSYTVRFEREDKA